jgi:hypothetical protein
MKLKNIPKKQKIAIQRIKTTYSIKIKWNSIINDEIKK